MSAVLRTQCASCSLSEESCNQDTHALLLIWDMIGLSGRLEYKGRDLSLLLLPGLSLTSLFRPQSDDDVKRGTIVIRLRRSYAREALLGAACFRRRKNFLQRLIGQRLSYGATVVLDKMSSHRPNQLNNTGIRLTHRLPF